VCLIVSIPETSVMIRPRPDFDCCAAEKRNDLANKFSQYECLVGAEHVCLRHPSSLVMRVSEI
jgi:hypothetical protein